MAVKEDWVRVELPPDVQAAAEELARLRHERWDHRVQVHGSVTAENNRLGAFGEFGFCHLLGKPHPHPDGWLESELEHGSDCYGWEVRCRAKPNYGLNLHAGDEGKRFVLALGHELPDVVWLAGCLGADEGFRLGKWREDGEGDKRWCLVDQRHLRPLGPARKVERERANGHRPAVAGASYAAQAVTGSLWKHRKIHGWKPGMVWDPAAWPGHLECGCRKPCGGYRWPDRGGGDG